MGEHGMRELTTPERRVIRELVARHCANYDRAAKECLPLECACYMLGKTYTGAFCRYFEGAVLPLDPMLVESLAGRAAATKPCPVCGTEFAGDGRQIYCAPACKKRAKRTRDRAWMRERRIEG